MNKIIWSLCLMGMASPGLAFFQKTKETATEQVSPVKVHVQGADAALAENLEAFLPSLRNLQCNSSPERVERFIDAALPKLEEGAQALGYYDARFQMTPTRQGNCLALHVAVQPGEPVRVAAMRVQVSGAGRDLPEFQAIRAKPPYQVGDVLVHQDYEDFKASLNRTANNLGFFDATYIEREIRVNTDTRQAEVNLHFSTGERYRIGKVEVQQDVLDAKHLHRYVRVQEGDAYNVENLLKQQRILEGSGYYKDVVISGDYQQAEGGAVPVSIKTLRRKRYSYTGQLGYGTDTGLRTQAGMDIHWVNAKGHKVNAKTRLAQREQSVETSYRVPLWHPEHEYTSFSAGWQRTAEDSIQSRAFKVGVDYNRRSDNDWQQTLFINHLRETTQVTGEPELKSQLTLLGGRVKKTQRDNLLFPSRGWQIAAEVQGAKKGLLSDQSVLQGKVYGKLLHTRPQRDKLILQGTAGTTLTNDLNEMPKSLRFFAGGQNSVRGYAYESLGETNDQGELIGGKHVLTVSSEYERPLQGDFSAAVFVDAGNAFDDVANLSMKVGAGVGVRYKSPLGPIRADVAVPVDNPGDPHFYFSLGPDL